jgi:hypothetical protein
LQEYAPDQFSQYMKFQWIGARTAATGSVSPGRFRFRDTASELAALAAFVNVAADGQVPAFAPEGGRQGVFSGLPLDDPVNGCIFRHIRHKWRSNTEASAANCG